ncbi:MAG TPA: Kiwa anti-phage protein KwaB-like domain-containing protein [Candidatus Saccharimonadales bacterium]|nr:Kiwa anti-phage protein KwaB-like domain-containing protein [Candidatus Saccharimonadales bacterium]
MKDDNAVVDREDMVVQDEAVAATEQAAVEVEAAEAAQIVKDAEDTDTAEPAAEESTDDVPADESEAKTEAAAEDDEADKPEQKPADGYVESDVFAWANNLVQFKDELKIELFFFNKNNVVYKTNLVGELKKQLEPLFIDEILEYVLEGADNGLIVRGFEDAEKEENVLQRTRLGKVEKAAEVLNWLRTQEREIELFNEEEHDIKRMKGIIARVSHQQMPKVFYVIKQLPQSQVMKGSAGWMIRDNKIVQFDADAALRIPPDNQLLVLDSDMYVFSEAKLKSLFGYDAKQASIAEQKVREIEENFKLSFGEGDSIQSLIKGKSKIIKKLQKIDPTMVTQDQILETAEEMGIEMMTDDAGAIIIMDGKDMDKFVNLLNDDYMESPMTGIRYEILNKRELKPEEENEGLAPESPFAPGAQ